ncbi:hypothetical protein ACTFQF_00555 [Aliivibrio fischeri]|uniref:Uncharacterized protein n=1 Tax=Aliivibrio fischeri (strain MJ11) TaxID=388396 RepID=B5EVU8_ALIFM|nr:hypothetical protein [Aliivibrio fischeri]ACH64727.1 hypothetical protein VFMJ11_B0005 [Aliivibrio fischeri MJ11]MUK37545.1 hypothetical protein [Aliivibrio fischeri]
MSVFGELVELYTQAAVLQLQRVPVTKGEVTVHNLQVTIAPLIAFNNQGSRKADFEQKVVMQLTESGIANLAIGLLGFKNAIAIEGSRHGENAKVLYLNVNENGTTNINISCSLKGQGASTNSRKTQSITFKNAERYPLVRIAVSQLAKNNTDHEQSYADTLNLLKACIMRP